MATQNYQKHKLTQKANQMPSYNIPIGYRVNMVNKRKQVWKDTVNCCFPVFHHVRTRHNLILQPQPLKKGHNSLEKTQIFLRFCHFCRYIWVWSELFTHPKKIFVVLCAIVSHNTHRMYVWVMHLVGFPMQILIRIHPRRLGFIHNP